MKKISGLMSLFLLSSPLYAAEMTVSAASSLTDAFKEIAGIYQQKYPNDTVKFNFAASGVLLQQMRNGAPVDVLASADQETMADAQKYQLMDNTSIGNFTSNHLVLITPIKSPLNLKNINGLQQAGVRRIAIGNPKTVPAGRYSQAALEKQGLWRALQGKLIQTQNVRQALDYVARSEVDAGLVYQTDAYQFKDKVKVVSKVATVKPIVYPIGISKNSPNKTAAKQFIQLLKSPMGQKVLQKHGFATVN